MDGPRFRIAVREALVALAGHVGVPWSRLRAVLPREHFNALCEAGLEPLDLHGAAHRVSVAAELHVGIATDVLRATLAELAERLGPDGRDELRGVLPRAWAELVIEPGERSDAANSVSLARGEPHSRGGHHVRGTGSLSASSSASGIVK